MKIVDVKAIPLYVGKVKETADPSQDAVIVKVYTDEGIVGFGEANSSPLIVKSIVEAPASHKYGHGLRTLLLGEDPFEREGLWWKMYLGTLNFGRRGAVINAMSGVDMALWDCVGKALDKPIYKLLGGAYRKKVRAYASVLFPPQLRKISELASQCLKRGFTAVKFGWGPMGEDPKKDVKMVKSAREAVGRDVELMIDAGICWDSTTAIQRAREFEEYNIYWLEEPLPPDDLDGYARLADAVETRIAAGEKQTTRYEFRDLIERARIDVVQPDVARAGGFTECKKIVDMCFLSNCECVPHVWGTGLNIAAALHMIATFPRPTFLEYALTESPLRNYLVRERFELEDGLVQVPEGSGLGVELDEKTVKKYSG